MSDPAVLISAEGITKSFPTPDGGTHTVLRGVSVDVHDGEVLALLGRSGSGKSTLLRCIAGLSLPTTGRVTSGGKPVTGPNPKTAMVFQTFALLPWLTVRQNVELGLEAHAMPVSERRGRAARAISLIGLDGFDDAYPRELSGGMRQRVGFARALVTEPDVLLMDEPFSALDVLTAENLRTELIQLLDSEEFVVKAVVVVTHNIEEAVTLADRIAVLDTSSGRIKALFDVEMPRPRERTGSSFQAYVDRVYDILTQRKGSQEADGNTPSGRGDSVDPDGRPLPLATTDGIAGFAAILSGEGDRSIAHLANDLRLEVDDLFPLVDSLDLLRFADVAHGRTHLTPAGQAYAAAPIQEAKRLFRDAALEHVQLLRMVVASLGRSPDHTMRRGFYLDLLRRRHTDKHARQQFDLAIDWGRYAELFEYDDLHDELKLIGRRVRARNANATAQSR